MKKSRSVMAVTADDVSSKRQWFHPLFVFSVKKSLHSSMHRTGKDDTTALSQGVSMSQTLPAPGPSIQWGSMNTALSAAGRCAQFEFYGFHTQNHQSLAHAHIQTQKLLFPHCLCYYFPDDLFLYSYPVQLNFESYLLCLGLWQLLIRSLCCNIF